MTHINLLMSASEHRITLSSGELCLLTYYQQADLAAIARLEAGASSHGWTAKNIEGSLSSSHHCIGLQCDGEWIAHGIFSLAADEAELLILSVAKGWQGKGVASVFLSTLASCLANYARELFLEVRESNVAAIALYEKLGFNQLGVRPNYYPKVSGREDALIFGLSLFLD